MSRSALMIGCSALLLTSAAPPPLPAHAARAPDATLPQDRSPVRCRTGQRGDSGYSPGRRNYAGAPTGIAPPMPAYVPPPPPPSPVYAPPAQEVAVSGVRSQIQSSQALKRAPGQTGAGHVGAPPPQPYGAAGNTERYDGKGVASILAVADQPVSTFSVDVDTGAYANVRRFLKQGQAVPAEAVRTEELINYFRYDYPRPNSSAEPFSVTTDLAATPWNKDTRLMRIGLRGYDVEASGRAPANLVFLVDVSGSMSDQDKLPLVKQSLMLAAERMGPKDTISIVVYAGAAGVVLEPTNKKHYVKAALECLEAGGSTAGGQGLQLAYDVARANYIKGGINRILLATDGDFNVGVSSNSAMEAMVKKQRESGITLTTLGFGQGNYNEAMMERIADVGNGNYSYIDSALEARKVLDDELAATLVTIAKDVKIQVEFNPAHVREYRLIGYENRALAEEDFANDTVDAGDIGAGHQVTALYEIVPAESAGWLPERRYAANRPEAAAGKGNELAFVKLRYKMPDGTTSKLIERPVPAGLMRSAAAPKGDMAFAVSVAAYGQRLRGDKYLNGFGFGDIATLAPASTNYLRSEFGELVRLADAQKARMASRD